MWNSSWCSPSWLVVMVIFLFLRNLAATFIPSVAVPLSIIGTFAAMYMLGYSLNNLTLMALTISTGFVVDDAIVMIENIIRYVEQGERPLEAALKGSAQIGFTIISLSVSLIAVLIPLLFMQDVVGRLFREFAITLSVTIVVSAVVSLTLTPMMCPTSSGTNARRRRAVLPALRKGVPVDHRLATPGCCGSSCGIGLDAVVAAATLVATAVLFYFIPKGFFPVQDTGVIQGISEGPQDTSFDLMADRQQALGDVILKDPDVESLSSFIGIDGTNITLNSGRIQINLKEWRHRTFRPPPLGGPERAKKLELTPAARQPAGDVIRRLTGDLAGVRGDHLYMQPVQDLTVEDRVSRTQYQYTLEDPDPAELADWTNRFMAKLGPARSARCGQRSAEQRPERNWSSTAKPPRA